MVNFDQDDLNIDCGASSRYRHEDKEGLESAKSVTDSLNPGLDTVWKTSRMDKILSFEKRKVDHDEKDSDVNGSNIIETTYMKRYHSQGSVVEKEADRSNDPEV